MNNQLKTILLVAALSSLVIGAGAMIAPQYLYGFAALALLTNLGAYFFSDRLVLRIHGAQEIDADQLPRLHEMVAELAQRAGIPKPRVFLIAEPQPNAFATGRNPATGVVAVTQGLLHVLSPRELRGVLAHEIAHIRNRDILVSSIAAAFVSLATYLAHALSLLPLLGRSESDGEEDGGLQGLALALVAPFAATLIQLGISRSREYMADETGAAICGDPEALASALEKLECAAQMVPASAPQPATASMFIVNPLHGAGSLLRLFSTHPSTEERCRRLRGLRGHWPLAA